jgi:hypothetical protein
MRQALHSAWALPKIGSVIIGKLNSEINAALADAKMKARLAD